MARKQDADRTPKSGETAAMSGIADYQRAGLGALAWMGTWWMEQIEDMGAEWLTFLAHRVSEDVRIQHRILRCTTPAEIQQIQAEFLLKAFEDYAAENGKLMEMGSAMHQHLQSAAAGEAPESEGHAMPL